MGKKSTIIIASVLLVCLALIFVFFNVIQNKKLFTTRFDPKMYERKFNLSQWVIPNSKNIISDEDLYAYSGYQYINGKNPILINPEVPPLGKYIIGISIAAFGNQRITSILAGILSLALIFFILHLSKSSFFVSSLGLFLCATSTLFIDQLIHAPQLDIFQLLFFLSFLYFFLLYLKKKLLIYLLLSGVFAGAFVSTKIFVASFVILDASLVGFYFLKKHIDRISAIKIIMLNMVIIITYAASYAIYFLNNGTLRSFLGVQKWIFLFYNSSQIDKFKLLGSYINLILLNRWKFWSDGYPTIRYESWSVVWPIVFLLGLFSTYKLLRLKKATQNGLVVFLAAFLIIYNIFLFITPIFPRYLLLLFIPMNMLIALYLGSKIEMKLKFQMSNIKSKS